MNGFINAMNKLNDIVWSMPLVFLCLAAGIWFSVRMRFPQIRLFRDMVKQLSPGSKSDTGISPFQAFATTVGSRVGMGNIAGVATAIFFGGPGAVFWMWVLAFIGAASAFVESALAHAYKIKTPDGEYLGGPQFFIGRALKCKPFAVVFALATILGPGILMPGVHINSIASTFNMAFGAKEIIVGAVFCAVLALVVCGGVKRIGTIAEYMAPVMCVIYVLIAIVIIVMKLGQVPHALGLIISSAFGFNAVFGGIIGSALAWGVKRGVYSNEAGQGSGAIVSAAADCSHPAKQGLVQALSVYIDTLVVCTSSALIILLTNTFNTQGADGTMLVENVPGLQYGILWVQQALNNAFGGTFGGKALAIIIIMFVFTSLMGYYYEAESNIRYMFGEKKSPLWIFRVVFILSCFTGVLVNGEVVWTMGDSGAGLMAWFNIIAILLLSGKAIALLKDYEEQRNLGRDPVFDPKKFGIDDKTGAWDKYQK